MDPEVKEICNIDLEHFIEKASQISCKVIGTIKTIFKHKVSLCKLRNTSWKFLWLAK